MKSRIWRDPFSAADRRWRYVVPFISGVGWALNQGHAPTWGQALREVNALHRKRRWLR